ncbi:MAG TPA: hypothetical protein VLA33_12965 [Gemmatimonadota bacterium]|nr:hypothetical protein [Gemmatimonadota bacterium]
MKLARPWPGTLFAALFILGMAPSAQAQDSDRSDGDALRREVFDYPADGRRDPFEPLSAGDELGPRFEDLRLAGVIFSPERGSMAVMVDAATGRRYRVWEGDVIGGARLVRVHPDRAEFQVTVFGVSRRDTLRLKTQDKEQDS